MPKKYKKHGKGRAYYQIANSRVMQDDTMPQPYKVFPDIFIYDKYASIYPQQKVVHFKKWSPNGRSSIRFLPFKLFSMRFDKYDTEYGKRFSEWLCKKYNDGVIHEKQFEGLFYMTSVMEILKAYLGDEYDFSETR